MEQEPRPRPFVRERAWLPARLSVGPCVAVLLVWPVMAAEPVAVRRPRVDPAVVQAGGKAHGADACSQCRRSACPQCRLATGHQQGHGHCQHGLCPAHCPVRPEVFGFYGTRWRKWPGSGVVQASNDEAATPARPPQTEVPDAAEESLEPDTQAENLPVPNAPKGPEAETSSSTGSDGDRVATATVAQQANAGVRQRQSDLSDEPAADSNKEPAAEAPVAETAASRTAWRTFTATGRSATEPEQVVESR